MRIISSLFCSVVVILSLIIVVSCADEKEIPAPEINLSVTDSIYYEVDLGDTLIIEPKITYDYNSTYKWLLDGVVMSTDKIMTIIPTQMIRQDYTFIVSNSSGSDTVHIPVYALKILDFEDLKMDKDTFLCGMDGRTHFISRDVKFPVTFFSEDTTWNGFAYSNRTKKTLLTSKNPFSAYPGYGAEKSANYLVYHQVAGNTPPRIAFNNNEHHVIRSLDLVNTSYMYGAIKNGTDLTAKFGVGDSDWYVLTIRGYKADGTLTKELSGYLADYQDPNKSKRYLLETWTTVNLEALGMVNQVEFILSSSDASNTLSYFCLDNLKLMD